METIGTRIKRLRTAQKLSQEALGGLCDVSRVAVTKWENGDTENLKLANLKKLCAVFRISVAELIDAAEMKPATVAQQDIAPYSAQVFQLPTDTPLRKELADHVDRMSDRGLIVLVEQAAQLADRFPRAKANHAN